VAGVCDLRLTDSCHVGFKRCKGHVGVYLFPYWILVIIFVSAYGVLPWANYLSTSVRGHMMVWSSNLRKLSENKTVWENEGGIEESSR